MNHPQHVNPALSNLDPHGGRKDDIVLRTAHRCEVAAVNPEAVRVASIHLDPSHRVWVGGQMHRVWYHGAVRCDHILEMPDRKRPSGIGTDVPYGLHVRVVQSLFAWLTINRIVRWRPHRDSNSGYRRERAVSWASRRWGRRARPFSTTTDRCAQLRAARLRTRSRAPS